MRLHLRAFRLTFSLVAVLIAVTAAKADTLYSDGAPSGNAGWVISPSPGPPAAASYQVQNSFTLSSASTLTAVTFGNELPPNTTGLTVEWMIVDSEGSQTPVCASCSGTASLTPDGTFTAFSSPPLLGINQKFVLPDISLPAGMYWLALQDEVTDNSIVPVAFWDLNGGPSLVWQSSLGDQSGVRCSTLVPLKATTCADAFTIIGSVSPVPEPGPLVLLGSAVLLGVEVRRRRHSLF